MGQERSVGTQASGDNKNITSTSVNGIQPEVLQPASNSRSPDQTPSSNGSEAPESKPQTQPDRLHAFHEILKEARRIDPQGIDTHWPVIRKTTTHSSQPTSIESQVKPRYIQFPLPEQQTTKPIYFHKVSVSRNIYEGHESLETGNAEVTTGLLPTSVIINKKTRTNEQMRKTPSVTETRRKIPNNEPFRFKMLRNRPTIWLIKAVGFWIRNDRNWNRKQRFYHRIDPRDHINERMAGMELVGIVGVTGTIWGILELMAAVGLF
jgi:hypothetical protein